MNDDFDDANASQGDNFKQSARSRLHAHADEAARSASGGIRARLFKVYFWVGKERNTSVVIAMGLLVIMFAQIFDLIISPLMQLPF